MTFSNPFFASKAPVQSDRPFWSSALDLVADPQGNLDFTLLRSKIEGIKVEDVVDLTQPWLWIAVASILFNPIFWNITARNGESESDFSSFRVHVRVSSSKFQGPEFRVGGIAAVNTPRPGGRAMGISVVGLEVGD